MARRTRIEGARQPRPEAIGRLQFTAGFVAGFMAAVMLLVVAGVLVAALILSGLAKGSGPVLT